MAPDWLNRIENPTPEVFVAMSNYLTFGCQFLDSPIKTIERMEKATVDQFAGKGKIERYCRINDAIRKAMGKLKDERDQAMEKRYGTRDILKATQRFTQMEVKRDTQSEDSGTEEKDILKSLVKL